MPVVATPRAAKAVEEFFSHLCDIVEKHGDAMWRCMEAIAAARGAAIDLSLLPILETMKRINQFLKML